MSWQGELRDGSCFFGFSKKKGNDYLHRVQETAALAMLV